MANVKLGRPSKERLAVLRNQVSYLLWNGKLETTVAKAANSTPNRNTPQKSKSKTIFIQDEKIK